MDYAFYTNTYGGSTLSETTLTAAVNKAEFVLNHITFNRYLRDKASIQSDTDILYRVNMALCTIADMAIQIDKRKGISNENTDGYSVSYTGTDYADMLDAVRIYLEDTYLIKRRARDADKCSGYYGL